MGQTRWKGRRDSKAQRETLRTVLNRAQEDGKEIHDMPMTCIARRLAPVALLALSACAGEQGPQLNVYSARHYDGDDALYRAFEEETGIELNVIEAGGDLLIERIRAEGERSPADVVITVDAGRLWRAEQEDLFQPIADEAILARTPEALRHPDGLWVAITQRARVIAYAPDRISPDAIESYADLADPALRGRICVRSSSNVYNVSLLAGLIERWGQDAAEAWARGVRQNLARPPRGGDTDQLRAVAAGECDVAVVNHYYYARLQNSQATEDQAVVEAVALVFPNQADTGVHMNVSGAGVAANAPNREAAERFIAFLLREDIQTLLANSNNEFPATDAPVDNPALEAMGSFRRESLNVQTYGARQSDAARLFDRVGWP